MTIKRRIQALEHARHLDDELEPPRIIALPSKRNPNYERVKEEIAALEKTGKRVTVIEIVEAKPRPED